MTPKQRRRIEFKQRNLVREIEAFEKVIAICETDGDEMRDSRRHLSALKRLSRWYAYALTTAAQPVLIDVPFAHQDR